MKPSFADAAFLVFWETTRACDLVCLHCRACALPARNLLAAARGELAELLGIRAAPALLRLRRRRHGLPIHDLGRVERGLLLHEHAGALDGVALAGSAHGGMGVADCIASGRRAAERVLAERFGHSLQRAAAAS